MPIVTGVVLIVVFPQPLLPIVVPEVPYVVPEVPYVVPPVV